MFAEMTMSSAQAWTFLISSIFAGVTGLVTIIVQSRNNSKAISQRDRVEYKVDKTVKQTNSSLGESLKQTMVFAQLLATQTKKPEHAEMAKLAEDAYNKHQSQQHEEQQHKDSKSTDSHQYS